MKTLSSLNSFNPPSDGQTLFKKPIIFKKTSMREDIQILRDTSDMVLQTTIEEPQYPLSLIEPPSSLIEYLTAEITVPYSTTVFEDIKANGLEVHSDKLDSTKGVQIRVKTLQPDGTPAYLLNSVGDTWFLCKAGLYGEALRPITAGGLASISPNFDLFLMFGETSVNVYSGGVTDVNIIPANDQNKMMLLDCVPTNNYRYPLLGVGAVRWIASPGLNDTLTQQLYDSFEQDNTPIVNATFDAETGVVGLDIDYSAADSEIRVTSSYTLSSELKEMLAEAQIKRFGASYTV